MEEFKSFYPLIHNKVTSPRYVTPLLRRARLLEWLNANAEARAIVIAAGAGYGKTTLLWQWEREVDFPCYWYKLDRNDRDWTLHISYLVEAISQHYPGFGRRAHSVLRQMGGPGSSRPGVAAFLLAEMQEKLRQPCTFIIDDWQYVASVTEVRGLWNQILRDAPPTCRFVFASRGKPQLQFARFKTHAGYAELRTDDLRVTAPELAELFRDVYHNPLTPDEAAELGRRTEGWAAGLQLVEVSLRERHTPEERRALIDSLTARTDSDLFSFLAEEVLDQQPEETRNFLLSTSILQQITPEVAERLAGVHDGMRHLLQLEHSGLFTNRLDETRYRYHGLFREFLERRLTDERSEAEVMGLHIHAASYFETSSQWPEAIYHYLRAGLQRQAARLIARYGEDVVSEGRLGMVDEWLQQLPAKTIHDNARLSLLHGEALGIRGDFDEAGITLKRAGTYFARKGDRRMESLALLKESSVNLMWGRTSEAADLASRGLDTSPPDERVLRLRLEGNVIMTSVCINSHLSLAVAGLRRLIAESDALGLEHYAAVGQHNLGIILREMGLLDESLAALQRASEFWSQDASNPYADNFEAVQTLVYLGRFDHANEYARRARMLTARWPRARAEALCGSATLQVARGQFREAADTLRTVLVSRDLGTTTEVAGTILSEALVLQGGHTEAIALAHDVLRGRQLDSRLAPSTSVALALAAHSVGSCEPGCTAEALRILQEWRGRGAELLWMVGQLKLAPQRLEHRESDAVSLCVEAIAAGEGMGILPALKVWTRRLADHAKKLVGEENGPESLALLLEKDFSFWSQVVAPILQGTPAQDRDPLLAVFARKGNSRTPYILAGSSPDIADTRARIAKARAPRIFVRLFGSLAVYVGGWSGHSIPIGKRRLRGLLSLLAARADEDVARDVVLDLLWPESDPSAAVNSLNQTIFQLRRVLDPGYRDGFSPTYLVSNSESVRLDNELVRTDLHEVKRQLIAGEANGAHGQIDKKRLSGALDLIRGEFLADVRYEDWARPIRDRVHAELRARLLPIATGEFKPVDHEFALRAAFAMTGIDPWDEVAQLSVVKHLTAAGRWQSAREAVETFRRRLQADLDEVPSPHFDAQVTQLLGNKNLTDGPSVS